MSIKPSLPKDFLQDLVRREFSAAAGPLQPLAEGQESQAFWFRCGTEDFVLRVRTSAEGFEKDAYAHAHFASAALPIPDVLTIGPAGSGHAYCISRKLPGVTVQDVNGDDIDALLAPVDTALRAIHATDISGTTGYGPFDAAGHGRFSSWRTFLLSILETGNDWERVRRKTDPALIEDLTQAFAALVPFCPEERHLLHGDFGSNNLLTDGRRITGVLDWEAASYGDPLFDMGGFWNPWLICMRKQSAFWEPLNSALPHYRERKLCYDLRMGLSEIYEHALDGQAETLAWVTNRSKDLLASL